VTIPHHTGPGTERADDGWLAAADRRLAATVALDGQHIVAIPAGHTLALAYTVGLWRSACHPEIAVTELEPPVATQLLHLLAAEVAAGVRFAPGDRLTGFLAGAALVFRASAPHTATACLRLAARFHEQGGFAALQALWPDLAGLFPGEPDGDPLLDERQPLLCPLP